MFNLIIFFAKNINFFATYTKRPPRNSNEVCKNILEMVGNTPLVHLKNLSDDLNVKCNLCKQLFIFKLCDISMNCRH